MSMYICITIILRLCVYKYIINTVNNIINTVNNIINTVNNIIEIIEIIHIFL